LVEVRTCVHPSLNVEQVPRVKADIPSFEDFEKQQWMQYAETTALAGGAAGWRVDTGGVKAIYFGGSKSTDEHVASRWAGHVSADDISYVETNGGQIVNRPAQPSLWSYLFIPVFPVLGFVLPWGAIKTLTWVGLGFFPQRLG
jgi:hypothetical protein